MLTINKPVQYGYRSVHDLPTPPSTSRPSPSFISQDFSQPAVAVFPRGGSPSNHHMAAPHRGLPLPAAMAPVQLPPAPGPSQPPPGSLSQAPPPLPPPQQGAGTAGQFPAAPSWQHVTEESMRSWLLAKTEEEKRRQEEEKTQQEKHRLERRKMELEILKASLQGGIPPPMVPVVFAGMGGGVLPQAAVEWAQQYIQSPTQQAHPPALMAPGPISPEHQRRDSQAQAYHQYPPPGGVPSTPGSGGGPPPSAYMASSRYPASPNTRQRGQTISGPPGGPSHGGGHLPSLDTNISRGPGGGAAGSGHAGIAQTQTQQQQQQDAQPSPSIYFHHWQPPTSQSGGRSGSDQPATPSGESPRKRKATGPQPAAPPPSVTQRFRSPPPFSHSVGLANPPPGRRRGHSRQRSDLGTYRGAGRGRGEGGYGQGQGQGHGPSREISPMRTTPMGDASSQQAQYQQQQQHQQQQSQIAGGPQARSGAHSVSSLLSDNPPSPRQYATAASAPGAQHHHHQYGGELGEREQGTSSPRPFEEKTRGGAPGSAATREGDND
ncbi:hypothetical protein QBC37DRAFT_466217 [Rhypophila decipiens]|uniref:Uncharacterized protein n=1 Tax=Rhypophila decipiens TaxID=261697 RepID=A0AAN7B490_9PEZI|nr:hypothetical protein QBC37DRAFT_466217 [Rhypophila decipiens]